MESTTPEVRDDSDDEQLPDADNENSDAKSEAENSVREQNMNMNPQTARFSRTRTQTVKLPNQLMQIRSGSRKASAGGV